VILARYTNRQVIQSSLAILLLLLLIFLGQRFVQNLADAAQGKIASELVMQLMALQIPVFISYLLPLALFLGVLITLGRLYADHEMTVMQACGIGHQQVLQYLLPLTLFTAILTGYLTLNLAPTQLQTQQQILAEQKAKGDFSLITAGKFQQTSDGKKIIYVEQIDDDNLMTNVFFANQIVDDERVIMNAKQGEFWQDDAGNTLLKLTDGNQYKQNLVNQKMQRIEYQNYLLQLSSDQAKARRIKAKAISTEQLILSGDPELQAELQWRLGAPISCLILILMAIPLAQVKPRQGKFAKLLPAFLLYILYILLMATSKNLVTDGKLPTLVGLWWVHLLMLAICYQLYNKFNPKKWLTKS
jgi:lipopolysaccharide export system permease protein